MQHNISAFKSWTFLMLAIVFEVGGVSLMKMLEDPIFKYSVMGSMLACSYYFMALAITKIPVAIAYAIWEVVGLSLVVLLSFVLFEERLSMWQIFALILAGTGIVFINLGEKHEDDQEQPHES